VLQRQIRTPRLFSCTLVEDGIVEYGTKILRALILCLFSLATEAWAIPPDSFQDLMDRARDAQLAGKTDEAADLYRAALRLRPHFGPAEYGLGLMVSEQKKYEDAVALLSHALHDDPSLTAAYLFRGIAFLNLQKPDQALISLQQFYRLQPTDHEVRYYLAGAYTALGNYPKAAEFYAAQLEATPERTELWYFLGQCLLEIPRQTRADLLGGARGKHVSWMLDAQEQASKGEFTVAEGDFRESIKSDPQGPEGYVGLGNLFVGEGKYPQAKAQFFEALRRAPQNCRALEGLGDVELALGDVPQSVAQYARVSAATEACLEEPVPANLGLSQTEFSARLKFLSEYAASAKSKAAATFELHRLTGYALTGEEPGAARRLSQGAAGKAGRPAGKFQLCRTAIPRQEWLSSPSTNLFLANCMENLGDVEGAIKALSAAEPRSNSDLETGYWLFRLYLRLAQKVLAEFANRSPDSYLLSEVRAESLELQGRDGEAEQEYKKATAASGSDPNPFIEFGRFKCRRNELDDAETVLKEALARAPSNLRANDLMGQASFMKGDYAVAIPYLKNATQGDPGNEDTRIRWAEALEKTGEIQQAVTVLNQAPSDRDGRVHYVLAGFYRKLGQKEQMARAMAFFEAHKGQPQRGEPPN
jgi:tetratricopeptide (TPR) repeat protein